MRVRLRCRRRRYRLLLQRTIQRCRLVGRRHDFALSFRRRGSGQSTVKVGNGTFGLWHGERRKFIGDRSGEPVFGTTAPPPSAATSAATRAPFAAALIGARHVRLFLGFLLVGLALLG